MRAVADGIGAGNSVGRRASQQDTFLVDPLADGSLLGIVADGMGGHAEGALASRVAADAFRNAFRASHRKGRALRPTFERALEAANRAVDEAQRGRPERAGMGTTLLAAHLSPAGLAWVSVGDSLLLVATDGVLRRLNEDHSMRALAPRGRAGANRLRSAVSGDEIALVDCHPDPLRLVAGDRVLMASDGLLSLQMDQIARAVAESRAAPAQHAVDRLLGLVEAAAVPRQDNCTVLVLDPQAGGARAGGAPLRPGLLVSLCLAAALIATLALLW